MNESTSKKTSQKASEKNKKNRQTSGNRYPGYAPIVRTFSVSQQTSKKTSQQTSKKIGVMVCGHGSRNRNAAREFASLVERLRPHFGDLPVEHGFLEFCDPIINEGLDRLRACGVTRCYALPGMLFAAGHAKNDIPSVLNTYMSRHPEMEIIYGRDLGVDMKMIRAAGSRIMEAIESASTSEEISLSETMLVVVGRGSSDPDANSNISKVTRLLWEGLGFGWGETCYSGVTFPLVQPALRHAAKLGYRRIVVFPYFLFTGVLVKRIYEHTDIIAAEHTSTSQQIEFLKAPYLNDHELVIETFVDRLGEIESGANIMNCQLCKYREQVLGFEDQVGLEQRSHHHHVEGIGGGLENCPCGGDCDASCRDEEFCKKHNLPWTPLHDHSHDHDHNHSHSHDHDHTHHHHHPYPHADHPHGPVSLKKGK